MKAQATPIASRPTGDVQTHAADEFARSVGGRRRDAGAPIRARFVADDGPGKPALASLMSARGNGGGGRGGQVRIKLLLSLLWVAARAPYTVERPARAWAALLGLEDIDGRGVRRVHEATRDLSDRGFITVEDGGGRPSIITLLSETGDGTTFEPAPEAYNRLSKRHGPQSSLLVPHRYFRVPSSLWTDGHIARLRGPSLAMLLVLLEERRGAKTGVWFSPGRAEERFGLSPSTRTQGLAHLRELGLVSTSVRSVSESGAYIDFARRRRVHTIRDL